MNHKTKVSVILPVFNGEEFIGQAIQSVFNQTFKDFELIIVDDGSTDNTIETIQQFEDSRIHLVRHKKNKGNCVARNTGFNFAKGEWVAPIDADDVWHRDRLTRLLEVSEKFPDGFIGSDVMICLSGRNKELIPWKTLFENRKLELDYLYFPNTLDLVKHGLDVKPIFPREAVQRFNIKFRQEFRGHEWMYFLLKLFAIGLKLIIINEPLYYYRLREGSGSTNYSCMKTQINACQYLQSVDWLDQETRELIKKEAKYSKYRLLLAAIRERRWIKVLQHAIFMPLSIFYLLSRIPHRLWRQIEFYKLQKIAINKNQ